MSSASGWQLALPKHGERRCGIVALLAALVATMLLVLAAACPGVALAGTTNMGSCHVEDRDGNPLWDDTGFGPSEALGWVQGAGKEQCVEKGGVIVMDSDWTFGAAQTISSGNSVTIKTNGHKISRDYKATDKGCLFWLEGNSTLTLDGSDQPDHIFTSVKVYTGDDYDSTEERLFITGGMLVGGNSENSGGAVEMKTGSTLNLINVTIAGNKADTANGGAVRMDGDSCTLNMTNSAIEYNVAEVDWAHTSGGEGGAVYADGQYTTINLNGSSISHNAAQIGGAIYCNKADATINMRNASCVDSNRAIGSGSGNNSCGAIYFNDSGFKLIGNTANGDAQSISYNECVNARAGAIRTADTSDGGEIQGITFKENKAPNGIAGAIYADAGGVTISSCVFEGNSTGKDGGAVYGDGNSLTVKDCTFKKNTASGNGGALYLNHSKALVQRCTFTGNKATGSSSEGGAIYNTAGKEGRNTLDTCTITGNYATKDGGGVFQSCETSLAVTGVLRIYDNTRQGDSADDVFINSNDAGPGSVDGYLDGNVSAGSWIGLRTSSDGTFKVVKDITTYIEGTYFMDLPNSFALSYDSKEHILSQVAKDNQKFKVTINDLGDYEDLPGETCEIDATGFTYSQGKAFWKWDVEGTRGLKGTETLEGLTGGDLTKSEIKLTVPGNDVHLAATYVAYLESLSVSYDLPVPGEDLPEKATLSWTDESSTIHFTECDITWKKLLGSDTGSFTDATGTAEYNTTYNAWITLPVDYETGLVPGKLTKDGVTVYAGGDKTGVKASNVLTDKETGATTVYTTSYTTPKKKIVAVTAPQDVTVYAGIDVADLAKEMPTTVAAVGEDHSNVDLQLEDATSSTFDWKTSGILDENNKVVEPASDQETVKYDFKLKVVDESVDVPELLSTVTVTVVVKHPVCTVTIDKADGTAATSEAVEWGTVFPTPETPEREGHDFVGWYDEATKAEFDFKAPIKGDVKVYAEWQRKTYDVHFQATDATPSDQHATVEWDTLVSEPTEPTMDHYVFAGWYEQGGETPFDFKQTTVKSNLTLYAHWTPRIYAVVFDPATGEQVDEVPTTYNQCVKAPETPTRPGYTFLGWYDADGHEWNFATPVTDDMTLTARWNTAAPTTFVDLTEDWYKGWVSAAAERGLMTGYTDGVGNYTGCFGPDDTLTRGQVATVLWRVVGCPNPASTDHFDADDVDPSVYYATAVNWCYEQGIITGYTSGANAGKFLPCNNVTREELATMVYRFAQWGGINTADVPTANFDRCVDTALVSAWAHDASVWCAAANVVNGKEIAEGDSAIYRLDPQQTATRAQAAKVFVTLDMLYTDGVQPYVPAQPDDTTSGDGDVSGDASTQAEVSFEEVATFDTVDEVVADEQPAAEAEATDEAAPEAAEEAAPEAAETVEQPEAAEEQADASFEDVEFDMAA